MATLCTIRLLAALPSEAGERVSCIGFATPPMGNAALTAAVEEAGWGERITNYVLPGTAGDGSGREMVLTERRYHPVQSSHEALLEMCSASLHTLPLPHTPHAHKASHRPTQPTATRVLPLLCCSAEDWVPGALALWASTHPTASVSKQHSAAGPAASPGSYPTAMAAHGCVC